MAAIKEIPRRTSNPYVTMASRWNSGINKYHCAMLGTGAVPGTAINAFDPTIEQAQVLAMVANVSRVLETSTRTPDLGGKATTVQVAEAVAKAISK